jgi:hypothetical protein
MPGEDPWAMIDSTERVLNLAPAALATSHRGLLLEPETILREQRDYLQNLAGEIARLHSSGMSVEAIVRQIFGGEQNVPGREMTWREASAGEFSTRRWVKAFLRRPAGLRRGSLGPFGELEPDHDDAHHDQPSS